MFPHVDLEIQMDSYRVGTRVVSLSMIIIWCQRQSGTVSVSGLNIAKRKRGRPFCVGDKNNAVVNNVVI